MTTTDLRTDPEIMAFFNPDKVQISSSEVPVGEWPIFAWCQAFGDRNPVYLDRDAARSYGHQDIFAPPVMMHALTFPGGKLFDATETLIDAFQHKLTDYGITYNLAGNYEQEFVTPIRMGDRLIREMRFDTISEEKSTAVGSGHFVLLTEKIFNQRGELIGNQKMQILFFRPGAPKQDSRPARSEKAASATADSGECIALPSLTIPLTTTLVVAAAFATNDFIRIHHDRDLAQRQGLKDIVMNILSTCGFATRYVTDWAGPAAKIRHHTSKFGVPNHPGDTMTLTGWADRPFEPGRETKITLRGTNSMGTHVTSTVTIG
jgi:acyl dehydratase